MNQNKGIPLPAQTASHSFPPHLTMHPLAQNLDMSGWLRSPSGRSNQSPYYSLVDAARLAVLPGRERMCMPVPHSREDFSLLVRANVQNLLAPRVGREKAVCGRRKDAIWKRAGDSTAYDSWGSQCRVSHRESYVYTGVMEGALLITLFWVQ